MINELEGESRKKIEMNIISILQINEPKDYPVKYECVCVRNRNESCSMYAERVHNRKWS